MLRAWVAITDTGLTVGVEHAPACPYLVEQHEDPEYCRRAADSVAPAEHEVELAFDAATRAVEPWWRRAWVWLGGRRQWTHDGSLHHHFADGGCALWIELGLAREELRLHAAHAAHVYLRERGYMVEDEPFFS